MLVCAGIERDAHTSYFANLLWGILQFASHGKSEYPAWAEVFAQRREDDAETAEDIRDKLLRELQ